MNAIIFGSKTAIYVLVNDILYTAGNSCYPVLVVGDGALTRRPMFNIILTNTKNGYLRLFWVQNYGVAIDNLAGEISVLDGYYIPTRYPNGLPDGIPAQVYNRKSAEDALQLVEKTVEFAKKLLLSDS